LQEKSGIAALRTALQGLMVTLKNSVSLYVNGYKQFTVDCTTPNCDG